MMHKQNTKTFILYCLSIMLVALNAFACCCTQRINSTSILLYIFNVLLIVLLPLATLFALDDYFTASSSGPPYTRFIRSVLKMLLTLNVFYCIGIFFYIPLMTPYLETLYVINFVIQLIILLYCLIATKSMIFCFAFVTFILTLSSTIGTIMFLVKKME